MSDAPDDRPRAPGEVAAELADTLAELRSELDDERRPARVRDLVRFTERYTIPTIIAILEANIRLLELLAGSLRLATGDLDREPRGGRRDRRERDGQSGDVARAGAELLARTGERTATATLDALDGALTDAARALEGGDPPDPEARRLLREARRLRGDLDDRLREATDDGGGGSADLDDPDGPDGPDGATGPDGGTGIPVDVDAELRSIREDVHGRSEKSEDEGHDGDDPA